MRLILCHKNFNFPKSVQIPDETFTFLCWEDFSVGPLGDWRDLTEFRRSREAFWSKSTGSVLPDGSAMPHFVWTQILPKFDLVEMHKNGIDIDDAALPLEFDDAAPVATEIEVWRDQSVNGVIFQWYLSALLPTMGIDLSNVSICLFPQANSEKFTEQFWSEMLCDMQNRDYPARELSLSDWQKMLQCWEAVANLPDPIDASMHKTSDKHALQAFEVMKGRQPDVLTGLNNIQLRILRATSVDWKKMARSIGDAMVAGGNVDDHVPVNTLEATLNEMAKMPHPLIEKRGVGPMHKCDVRLTAQGQRKLRQISENI